MKVCTKIYYGSPLVALNRESFDSCRGEVIYYWEGGWELLYIQPPSDQPTGIGVSDFPPFGK